MRHFLFALLLLAAAPAWTQKAVVSQGWQITPSFDGLLYSAYPTGDKPCCYRTVPTLIGTDIVAGATTHGENGKGAYVSLFGYSFGRQSKLGTPAGARVFFQNPDTLAWLEADNYRALNASRTFFRNQVERLIVQIGALGGIAAGKVLNIKVTVNGVDSNVLAHAFTVQPGRFFYVSNGAQADGTPVGSETTGMVDDIAHPFRYLQVYNEASRTFSGIWASLQPGDTIVIRGGTYSDTTGFEGRWARLTTQSGSAPNGVNGHGYLHIVAYPGAVLGHHPDDVHFVDVANGSGGIEGPHTAQAAAGAGKYVSISGLHLELNPTSISDAAPVNLQNGADNWRVVDNELGPWLSTTRGADRAKCGGLCGQGAGTPGPYVAFNYIHDIYGDPDYLENHGIYVGDSGGDNAVGSDNWEIAYNVIQNIPGGSAVQWNNSETEDLATGMRFHHNYIEGAGKYGINLGHHLQSADIWDNVVVVGGNARAALAFLAEVPNSAIRITHNTFRQLSGSGAYHQVIAKEVEDLRQGSIRVDHNILQTTAANGSGMIFFGFDQGDTAVLARENLYHDIAGTLTAPSIDSFGVLGDPRFTDVTTGNFTVLAGSPALGACTQAESVPIPTDFYGVARPVPGTATPSSPRNDIGAMQGVGQ